MGSSSSSQSLKLNSGATMNLSLSLSSPVQVLKPEEKGVELIKLLLTCANHASSGNIFHADASLQQILELASVTGDSTQRLASRFASALAIRLIKRWPGLYKALYHQTITKSLDLDHARSVFAQTFPYMGFAYAIVNRTLIQAMTTEESIIHIVDLGCGDPKLWIPFLQSLAVQVPKGDSSSPKLKITCVHQNRAVLEQLETKLLKEAARLDIPFQFNPVNVSLRELTSNMLKVRPGETLAFTSILNLHILLAEDDRINSHLVFNKKDRELKDSKAMSEFLTMISSLSPKVVLLVEQESHHNLTRLTDRFVQALHYYSALFDSISTSFGGSSSKERFAVEEMFGKEIENIVACEGLERDERHEPYEMWSIRLGRAGFRPIRLWRETVEDAKRLVQAFGLEGYNIINQGASLAISWHDRSIYTVSAWNCFRK